MYFLEKLAEFVTKTSFENINTVTKKNAEHFFIDCLGCMVAGSSEPAAEIVSAYAEEMGGNKAATVVGRGFKTTPYQAAVINGVSAHVLDFDDVSAGLTGHPSVVVLPAVLALGEQRKISGKAALESYIIGVEVACAIGRGMNPRHYSKGWHTTSSLGIFGAAAAAGKILGLNKEEMVNALAIAASEASGLKINFGTMTKSFHAGRAAAKGLMASLLASRGFTASKEAFEGEAGFAPVTTQEYNLDKILKTIGNPFEFEEPGLSIKPYSSCKGTHNGIDAMLYLAKEYDLKPEDVERIDCGVQPVAKDILIYPDPQTGLEGKFSMNFCVALALVEREVKLEHFSDSKVLDPLIQSVIKKVSMEIDPEMAKISYFRGTWDTEVTVTTKDGRVYKKRVDDAKGDPKNPLTEEELYGKYRDCASLVLPKEKVEQSDALFRRLTEIGDINELLSLLAGKRLF